MPSQVSVAGVAGVALLVAGVILMVASSVPIPYVEDAPRVETGVTTTPSLAVVKVSLLNETFAVGAGKAHARCYGSSFPPGITLHIAVKVLSGGDRKINFLVMDEPEWRVFEAGGSPYHYSVPSRRNATEVRVTWNPPSDQRLCFVFDNKFSTTSKTVHAEITASYEGYTYVTKTYTSTVYEPAIRYRTLGHLQTLGLVVLVAGAVLVIASWYVSARQKPAGA